MLDEYVPLDAVGELTDKAWAGNTDAINKMAPVSAKVFPHGFLVIFLSASPNKLFFAK